MKINRVFTVLISLMAGTVIQANACTEEAYSVQTIECGEQDLKVNIQLFKMNNEPQFIQWNVSIAGHPEADFTGIGSWQKEIESADAFSSYNGTTAISFKNNKVALVLGESTALILRCEY